MDCALNNLHYFIIAIQKLDTNPKLPFDSLELVDRPWFPYLCTEVEHWQWETHGDGHYNFWIALSGEGYLSCEGQTFRLQPGMFFIFSPKQRVSAAHYSGTRITRFSAHFHPICDGQRLEAVNGFPLMGAEVPSLTVLKRQIDACMRIAFRREDDAKLASILYDLIAQCCGHGSNSSEVLHPKIAESIRQFREAPASIVSMNRYTSQLGLSRSHFDREFTRQVGMPPNQFLVNCKMIQARRFLESSSLRVGEIAETLGYKDIYFFSRQFKQFTGLSPKHYRLALHVEP